MPWVSPITATWPATSYGSTALRALRQRDGGVYVELEGFAETTNIAGAYSFVAAWILIHPKKRSGSPLGTLLGSSEWSVDGRVPQGE